MSENTTDSSHENEGGLEEFVTVTIGDQWFGVPVMSVQDVLGPQKITHIPLAPPEVAGALNLRGRIVTALDMRRRLGLPPQDEESKSESMSVVVDMGGELYSLIVDTVGEVLRLSIDDMEKPPATMEEGWREVCAGIFQLDGKLLLVIDVDRLLEIRETPIAA